MNNKKRKLYENCVKRVLDVFFACVFLIVFCWLFLLLSLLVKINVSSPVLFRQKRIGKDEKVFEILKFRTMTDECDENGRLLPDEKRMTKFGRFLRRTSLDEIPEIFNVLRGEMSFVGPRPLLEEYLPFYTQKERRRHSVMPGITGLAQVNGRNNVDSWEKRFEYDLEYVNNVTFSGDAKIVLKSIKTIVTESGAEPDGGIKEGPLNVVRGGEEGRKK